MQPNKARIGIDMSDNADVAKITAILALGTSSPGQVVNVGVGVENIDTQWRSIRCYVLFVVGSNVYLMFDIIRAIQPGAVEAFLGSFIMPNIGVEIKAYTYFYYHEEAVWLFGDYENDFVYLPVSMFKNLVLSNYNGG